MTEAVQEMSARVAPNSGAGVEECWIDLDGARMRYLRAGSGPALILLHGLLGYSFSWRYTLPALAPYAAVYAPDMLGAGFSERPAGIDHSVRATALRVLKFVEKLGISSFDLLGTSRGGAVAMAAAAECLKTRSASVRGLILVAPVNPYSPHGKRLASFLGSRAGSVVFLHTFPHMPFLHRFCHHRMFGDRNRIPPDSFEGYRAPLAIPGLFDHGLRIASTWTEDLHELEAVLPKLNSIPTLLIWGGKDPAVYASSAGPLARHFAHCQTVIFPGIGHLPYEECPEEFNRSLIAFLSRAGPA
jgi:pimeloyl-ACP methyl ester carboxylesterase